jgi:LysR family transcriptional activator of nhaA
MEWLNYHHLLYFWTCVREGGVGKAAVRLRLSPQTVSEQIKALEASLGEPLLQRRGRAVEPTETGRVVLKYAEEIFTLGRELQDTVRRHDGGAALLLRVGVAQTLPKLVVRQLLAPAFALPLQAPVRLSVVDGEPERLLARLSLHELDLVLSDGPIPPGSPVRAFNHLLAESGVGLFGTAALHREHAKGFPKSLEGAPLLLPLPGTALRRSIDSWLEQHGLRPRLVAEIEDSALLNTFGEQGLGLFPAPLSVEAEVVREHGVRLVGRLDGVSEKSWALSGERRLRHPAVVAIRDAARAGRGEERA